VQSHHDPVTGNDFVDTPGLADVKMREEAAHEISKALRHKEGDYKIVFIVAEESGRVRPTDGVTMKLVLDALPDKRTPYGIVVNKMTRKKINGWGPNSSERRTFVACLNEGRENKTSFIYFYPRLDELEDEENALHKPEDSFVQ